MRKHFKWTSIICGILSFALFLDCMNQKRFQVVYAENEAKAKAMAEEIAYSMNMGHFRQVVDERLEDMKE